MNKKIYQQNKPFANPWREKIRQYNCGSFALNTTDWYCPFNEEEENNRLSLIREMYDEGFSREAILESLLEIDQEFILDSCPWIEPIFLSEAKADDRLIAYRLFLDRDMLEAGEVDEDYHFRVRINGFWFEKCGEEEVRFCGTVADEQPWKTTSYLVYDSDVKYFRFKKI